MHCQEFLKYRQKFPQIPEHFLRRRIGPVFAVINGLEVLENYKVIGCLDFFVTFGKYEQHRRKEFHIVRQGIYLLEHFCSAEFLSLHFLFVNNS